MTLPAIETTLSGLLVIKLPSGLTVLRESKPEPTAPPIWGGTKAKVLPIRKDKKPAPEVAPPTNDQRMLAALDDHATVSGLASELGCGTSTVYSAIGRLRNQKAKVATMDRAGKTLGEICATLREKPGHIMMLRDKHLRLIRSYTTHSIKWEAVDWANKTNTQIAKELELHRATVGKWRKKLGQPHGTRKHHNAHDWGDTNWAYNNQQLAEQTGFHVTWVARQRLRARR